MNLNKIGNLSKKSLKILKVLLSLEKKIINSEEISEILGLKEKGRELGAALSAISKAKLGKESIITPWGKISKKVTRIRKGKKAKITLAVQRWKINQGLIENKAEVLKRIEAILKSY